MYWLLSIDAVIRIALAIAFLFILVPRLAWPRRHTETFLEGFFWNFGVGITLLTLVGQLLTLGSLFSLLTILLACALIILVARATYTLVTPWALFRDLSERTFLVLLNVFDGRISVRRRFKRWYRRTIANLGARMQTRSARIQFAAWILLTLVAAGFRLYRPMASANLGFSDTYVHLYLVKLLEEGRQVDPAWGPYPRGMHFLLGAIQRITNVDEILLMNYFGVFVGVVMVLGVADTARRLSKSVTGGLIAGLLYATLIGGPGQYFILGGAFETADPSLAKNLSRLSYRELFDAGGEFDIALTAFSRQTSTLSQELAMALLFPAAMFLLDYFRKRNRWHLIGFGGSTAAIAAVHSGVLLPLVLMCALMLVVVAAGRNMEAGTARPAILTGAAGVLVGSSWALAFIAYPYSGGQSVSAATLYYFPFLRPLGNQPDPRVYVTLTPFLIACVVVALLLIVSAFSGRHEIAINRIWISSVFLMFLLMHFASMLGLPRIVETMRNSQWLLMSICILLGVASQPRKAQGERQKAKGEGPLFYAFRLSPLAFSLLLLAFWLVRVPAMGSPAIRDRIVNYSGYGGSAFAVLRIDRTFEPFTWTLVSYGQEFPMVLQRGFHLSAADFLERYDPEAPDTSIPTPNVFIIVEKTPHRFEINTWAKRFSRTDLEQRLLTWVQLYQMTHKNISVFFEDQNVRVYQVTR